MSGTFSESWHRVANARLALLPTVAVHKQRFRGQDWYVLRDTYTQRFFRVTPQAYAFLARLGLQRTVEEVWLSLLRDMPAEAPGQEEVMQLLGQMHQSNLLYHDTPSDSQTIFTRYREFKQREFQGKVLDSCRSASLCGIRTAGSTRSAPCPTRWSVGRWRWPCWPSCWRVVRRPFHTASVFGARPKASLCWTTLSCCTCAWR